MYIKDFFSKNITLKIISVVIAIIIWFNAGLDKMIKIESSLPINVYSIPDSMLITHINNKYIDVIMQAKVRDFILMHVFSNMPKVEINLSDHKINNNKYSIVIDRSMLSIPMEANISILKIKNPEIQIILDTIMIKEVGVLPVISGKPAHGYVRISSLKYSPKKVKIIGGKNLIESINSIETEKIDINGIKKDFSAKVKLKLPNKYVKIIPLKIAVFIPIDKKMEKTFNKIPVTFINKPEYKIEPESLFVNIKISGPQKNVERVLSGELSPVIDLSNIKSTGEYFYDIDIKTIGYEIVLIEPKTIRILVK